MRKEQSANKLMILIGQLPISRLIEFQIMYVKKLRTSVSVKESTTDHFNVPTFKCGT